MLRKTWSSGGQWGRATSNDGHWTSGTEMNWTETDWWCPFFRLRNSIVCQQFTTFPSPPHPQGVFYNCSIASMRTFWSNAHLHNYCLPRPSKPRLCRSGYSPTGRKQCWCRPSKWDRLVSCYSYHRRYWPGVLWFPLLILLRCTVERGYVGNRGSLLRGSHRQIGQWQSHRGILFGEPKTHEGNTNIQNL